MEKDLKLFYDIREAANSGVYKYRTKVEIDSIYRWAYEEIERSTTLGDFYNILCKITDFEGSLHNDTELPEKIVTAMAEEQEGYFPFMLKLIEGKWVCNNNNVAVPLGSALLSINGVEIDTIIHELYRYYTTDGFNITGKQIGINYSFPFYYRMRFRKQDQFEIAYLDTNDRQHSVTLKSISYQAYRKQRAERHSKSADYLNYTHFTSLKKSGELYHSQLLNDSTAIITVNSFVIGWNAQHPDHKAYVRYLDSVFTHFKEQSIKHLIVDVRYNGGGADPNDLVTYSYLTNRNFQENVQAWIPFRKIPYWRRVKGELFFLAKPIAKMIYQKELKQDFELEKEGKYYQTESSNDHKVWSPNPNAFTGQIYLLISPRVASAGSMFAAMLASDSTTITIGEETQGGYYGHNGHTPIRYQLKHSKIKTSWSLVNLEQDVRPKPIQPFGSGIRPHFEVKPSMSDFLKNEDPVMKFVLELISAKKNGQQ
ncbi:MAG: S41 family peptidase [Bacteroidota bacterium]